MAELDASKPQSKAQPNRSRGWWRSRPRWLRISIAALALLIALITFGEISGWPWLRGPVETRMTNALGVPVQIEAPFRLHLIGRPSLKVEHLRIGAPSGIDVPFLLDARRIDLGWRWRDAWAFSRGDVLRLTKLHAASIESYLRRTADGRASWALHPADEGGAGKTQTPTPRIDSVQLASGMIHVDDTPLQLKLEAEMRLDDSLQPGGATEGAAGSASAPGGAASSSRPGFEIVAKGTYRGSPAEASIRSPRVLPLVAGDASQVKLDTSVRLEVNRAKLAFDGTLVDLFGARGIDGEVALSGPSLGVFIPIGVVLPETPPFALKAHVSRPGPVWQVDIADATVGRSQLAGAFRYDPTPSVPLLTGTLRGARLALPDLAPAVGAPPTGVPNAAAQRAHVEGGTRKVLPQRDFDIPSLAAMNALVDVDLHELDLGTTALAPLRPAKARITLQDSVLTVDQLDARNTSGNLTGSTTLDGRTNPPHWKADLGFNHIDLATFVKGTRKSDTAPPQTAVAAAKERQDAEQNKGAPRSYLTGIMNADVHVTGTGKSTAAILGSLDGRAKAVIDDGTVSHLAMELAGLDVAQALGELVKGDDALKLQCAAFALHAEKGVLQPRVAVLDTTDTTVVISGDIDLAQEKLNLRTVVHPKDFTFFSLRTPVRLEGTFADPSVQLEKGSLIRRVAVGAALAFVNPFAAIIPFLDRGDPEERPPCGEKAIRQLAASDGRKESAPSEPTTGNKKQGSPPAVPASPAPAPPARKPSTDASIAPRG